MGVAAGAELIAGGLGLTGRDLTAAFKLLPVIVPFPLFSFPLLLPLGAGAELGGGEVEGTFGALVILFDELGLSDEEVAVVGPVAVGVLLDDDGDLFDGAVELLGDQGGVVDGQEGEHLQPLIVVVEVLLVEEEQALVHDLAGVEVAVVVGVGVVPELGDHALLLAALGGGAGSQDELEG